jgi:hypothetical protein
LVARTLSEKLATALPYHYGEARKYREFVREFRRDWAGRTTYPGHERATLLENDPEKQIVNLTLQSAEAFVMTFAANAPRFLVEPSASEADEGEAQRLERALDRLADGIYLGKTLKKIVRDAFSLVGIAKIFQADSLAVSVQANFRMEEDLPFLDRISIDRFVWDTSANSPEEASWMGDFYSMPFREAIRAKRFTPQVRKLIKDRGPETYSEQSDKAEDLARSQNAESVEDVVYFVDVFVRQPATIDGQRYRSHIRTYLCDRQLNVQLDHKCVHKIGWDGAECGPYYFLNMGPVPDHFMPSSPGQNQRLLAQLYNTLYRKLEAQARRQKQNIKVDKGQAEDADTIRDCLDGEIIELNGEVTPIRLDGPDQNNFGFMIHTGEQHSQANGNLKMKLGAAATADTATQQGMLAEASSQLDAARRDAYLEFLRDCAGGLGVLLYNDAKLKITGKWRIDSPHFQPTVTDDWLPYGQSYEDGTPARMGESYHYKFKIDPESTRFRSAAEKLAMLERDMQMFLPQMPVLAQMGVFIDVKEFFEEKKRLTGMEVYSRIFRTNQTPKAFEGASSGGGSSGGGPNGQYTHTSRSTRSPESEAMQYMQAPQQGQAVA